VSLLLGSCKWQFSGLCHDVQHSSLPLFYITTILNITLSQFGRDVQMLLLQTDNLILKTILSVRMCQEAYHSSLACLEILYFIFFYQFWYLYLAHYDWLLHTLNTSLIIFCTSECMPLVLVLNRIHGQYLID
jgi:hypothetical protein